MKTDENKKTEDKTETVLDQPASRVKGSHHG